MDGRESKPGRKNNHSNRLLTSVSHRYMIGGGGLNIRNWPITFTDSHFNWLSAYFRTSELVFHLQECIPVGCLPCVSVAVFGVYQGVYTPILIHCPHPLSTHPLSTPHVRTPSTHAATLVYVGIHPYGQNDWHTLVKALPSRNFISTQKQENYPPLW